VEEQLRAARRIFCRHQTFGSVHNSMRQTSQRWRRRAGSALSVAGVLPLTQTHIPQGVYLLRGSRVDTS